jgi:hypothetical protein
MAGLVPAISFDGAYFAAIPFWHAAQTFAGVAGMSM